jgi:nitrogen-specific signal transduction histidine kinase
MEYQGTHTEFAPAERTPAEVLSGQSRILSEQPFLREMMDCFPEPVVVLNQTRQIVLANDKMASLLQRTREEIIGSRPGEAVQCVYGSRADSGCGTTRFCRVCGAVQSVLNCQQTNQPQVEDCNLLCQGSEGPFSLDLRVWATPILVSGERFIVCALRDISAENRRRVLERVFFHDALNAAGGLRGVLSVIPELSPKELQEMGEMAQDCSTQLVELLESQRDLAAAEAGELHSERKPVEAGALISHLAALYQRHPVGKDKRVLIQGISTTVETDPVLLGRVLGNLIKNALEASSPGEIVTVGCTKMKEETIFSIHNPAVMPEELQLQLFQRSISTKGGQHRGIGTYSVKLLTEKYLNGSVSFQSHPGRGTTFEVRLPARSET